MKIYIKILILLIAASQISDVMASENITGIWQGKLITSPEAEITMQFIINQNFDGSYSARLNSSEQRTLKNVKASSVVYDSGILKLDIPDLSIAYEGVVNESKINGKWKQGGTSFPLNMNHNEKPKLSKKDMGKLLGQWCGEFPIPRFLTVVFRFKMTEKGEFIAFADNPDQGAYNIPVTDVELSDDNLRFIVPSACAEYTGKLADNKIYGEFKQDTRSVPLTLKKGEYKILVDKLIFSKEIQKDYETLVREMVEKIEEKVEEKIRPITADVRVEEN